jgi:hypothetical protein
MENDDDDIRDVPPCSGARLIMGGSFDRRAELRSWD